MYRVVSSALAALLVGGCAVEQPSTTGAVVVHVSNMGAGYATVSVLGGDGRPVDLRAMGATVEVDQRSGPDDAWRRIEDVTVSYDGPTQLDVVIVADNSGSEQGKLGPIQSASRTFAAALYARDSDTRLGLVRVSTESRVVQGLTPNSIQFDAAIDQLFIRNGWTALWDGVRMGQEVLERGIVVKNVRAPNTCADGSMRAVVVFTDGRDNNSRDEHLTRYTGDGVDTSLGDLSAMSVFGSRVPVFVVGVGDRIHDANLGSLAASTQGQLALIDDYSGLMARLEGIADELNQSLPVCFDVSPDTTEIRVQLRYVRDGELIEVDQVLPVPEDSCSIPGDTPPAIWQPLRELVPCSAVADLSSDDLVSLADLGCDPGDGSVPQYEQAQTVRAAQLYAPPSDAERAALLAGLPGFYAALTQEDSDLGPYAAMFAQSGMALREYTTDGRRWVVVYDDMPEWRGTGGYLFRKGAVESDTIVQAPHSFYDVSSGEIADYLMANASIRGFFFNTLHRRYLLPGATCDDGVNPADVGHVTNSFFYLMSTQYIAATATGTIVQLHGFTNEALAAQGFGVVASSGEQTPSLQLQRLDAALGDALAGQSVALYPVDTNLYGATLNIQGRWIRREDRGHFLHIELSRTVRAALVADAAELARFCSALASAL